MINKLDRYIFFRLLVMTVFVLATLIFIFIVIHFSDHSQDFIDNGATYAQIFSIYYLNYIPEIVRLVTPVAVFISCLYLTAQMADRLEIIALKAGGISLYRLFVPYLFFAVFAMLAVSYLDGFIVPKTNAKKLAFADKYLHNNYTNTSKKHVFRHISTNTLIKIGYYNSTKEQGRHIRIYTFSGDSVHKTTTAKTMDWIPDSNKWRLKDIKRHLYKPAGIKIIHIDSMDTSLNMLPRDIARKTSDISQLTYPQAQYYIQSLKRSGAGSIAAPRVQFYSRLTYPLSIIVVSVIGFALATVRRKGGKGFYIFLGLTISFIYLALMKIIQPFGSNGSLTPVEAALIPPIFFLLIGIGLLISVRK